jgi:hypothetical protein
MLAVCYDYEKNFAGRRISSKVDADCSFFDNLGVVHKFVPVRQTAKSSFVSKVYRV